MDSKITDKITVLAASGTHMTWSYSSSNYDIYVSGYDNIKIKTEASFYDNNVYEAVNQTNTYTTSTVLDGPCSLKKSESSTVLAYEDNNYLEYFSNGTSSSNYVIDDFHNISYIKEISNFLFSQIGHVLSGRDTYLKSTLKVLAESYGGTINSSRTTTTYYEDGSMTADYAVQILPPDGDIYYSPYSLEYVSTLDENGKITDMGLESYRYNDTSFDDPYFHSTEHFTLSASSLGDYSEEVPTTTITNDTIDTSTLADGNLDFTTTSSIISNLEAYQTKATKSVMSATLDSTDSTGFVYSQNETAQLYKNNIAATTGSITCNVDPANNLDSDSKPIYNATPYTQNYVTTLKPGNFAYDFKTVGTGSTAIFVADVTNSYNTFTADNELVTSNTITFALS